MPVNKKMYNLKKGDDNKKKAETAEERAKRLAAGNKRLEMEKEAMSKKAKLQGLTKEEFERQYRLKKELQGKPYQK